MPEQISSICVRWQVDSPFFAEFLLRFLYKEDENTPTAGIAPVNHKILFFYKKEFMEKLTPQEVEGLCAHEILHLLNKFHDRLGSRDMTIFNIAQDACINEIVEDTMISDRKLVLPKDGVKIKDIEGMGFKGEHISEIVYDFLEKNATKVYIVSSGSQGGGEKGECPVCGGGGKQDEKGEENSQGGGEGDKESEGKNKDGNSGGEGGQKKPHDPNCPLCGKDKGKKILRTTDDHTKQRPLTEIEKIVVQEIIDNAKTRSWGNISGNMQSAIKELIKTVSIPWQKKLALMMSRHVNEPGSIYENTWSKRNRRGLPLPGIKKMSKRVVVTVDTSGSVDDQTLMKFFGQIEKIIRNYSSMTLVQWDTEVHSSEPYKKGAWKKIKINGRGGTDPQKMYDHVQNNLKHTSLIVNFTDGYFNWGHINHYNIPTIWAVANNENLKPTFGKIVLIKDDNPRSRR
jgi:predicted metal-dependent peptidase